ncbi:MAG: molybdenum cofactor biosynthesis protein MoaE [Syntrophaceae bacterium]
MNLTVMIEKVKERPDFARAGMILTHTGIVRGSSRDGSPVREVEVRADREALARVTAEMKTRPGIIEVLAEVRDGRLKVGEEIMNVVVAGDIRENVFPVLIDTVNRIKAEVTRKQEL